MNWSKAYWLALLATSGVIGLNGFMYWRNPELDLMALGILDAGIFPGPAAMVGFRENKRIKEVQAQNGGK